MWELAKQLSHGRVSLRRISLWATSGMMAFFVANILLSPSAYADGATRSGSNVIYQNNTYTPASKSDIPPDVVKSTPDTSAYRYADTANHKVSYIFTTGDPTKATSGFYVIYDFTPPDHYSNASPPTTVAIAAATDTTTGTTDKSKDGKNACDGSTMGGIGWFVCPTVNFIAKGMDKIYGIISDFLVVKTVTTDTSSSLYQMWSYVKDIANVCFVIAFLIIVYSQVTHVGLSNYGVKRMLPRIVIAAILVNISFWVCAIAVDVSNLLGYSIHSMFVALMDKFSVGGNYHGSIPTWEQIAAVALSGGAVVGVGVFIAANTVGGAIFLLIPFLLGCVMAALIALVVLAARQALITCLVIISPLAFVAFILPNTEKYFNKWREGLTTLLMLFPIFSVVFSGAQLAGMAIIQSAGGNLFTILLGMAVQVAPIVITPLLVKFSGGLIGRIAGMVNNPNRGLIDRTRKWSQGMAAERKNRVLAGRVMPDGSIRHRRINGATRALDTRRRAREGRRKAYESMADNRFAATRQGMAVEAMSRNAAVHKSEIDNTFDRSRAGQRIMHRQQMAEVDKTQVSNEFNESTAGHQVDQARRVADANKRRIEHNHQANWDTAVRTDPELKQLELTVKASEVKASLAKGKLEEMHTNIEALGSKSEHVLNIRGVDKATQDHILHIARDIKTDSLETSFAATAKSMAERKIAQNRTMALNDNIITVDGGPDITTIDGKTIVEYAAGAMEGQGMRAVLARAKSEVSSAYIEDIKNSKNTMSYDLATDNVRLREAFENTDLLSEKVAYAQRMAQNGGPGVAALRQLFDDIGDFSNSSGRLVSKEDMFDFKELMAMEGSIMSAGKDMEFFLTNSTTNDSSGNPVKGPDGKPLYRTFGDLSTDVKTWTNLSATAFASQNASTQHYALKYLHDHDRAAYMQVINSIRSNPAALGSLKQGVYERFSIYSDTQRHADHTLPPPGTIR